MSDKPDGAENTKKTCLFLLILLSILCLQFLVDPIPYGNANTGTNVSGTITTDTTWTKSNGPYNLTDNVIINNGVTLTIEPGVFVDINGYNFVVNGTLHAVGTSEDEILFAGDSNGDIFFNVFAADWNQSAGTGCIIEHANIATYMAVYNSPKINNNTMYDRILTVANATISNCLIYGGISISGGQGIVSNNTVMGQGIIISSWTVNATVSDNTITACTEGITVYTKGGLDVGNFTSLIERNLIVDNTYGIRITAFSGDTLLTPLIQSNTIVSNIHGIYLVSYTSGESIPSIINNNIFDNGNYNILSNITTNVNAINNWWGTTDIQVINQTIYDYKDNPDCGAVTFEPFLTSPNTAAPTYTNASAGAEGSIRLWGITKLEYGANQTFTITANNGFHVADILVNGTSVGAVNTYTIQNITSATSIYAMFAVDPTPTPSSSSSSPTSSAKPTSTPTIPELSLTLILPLLLVTLVFAAIAKRKKTGALRSITFLIEHLFAV